LTMLDGLFQNTNIIVYDSCFISCRIPTVEAAFSKKNERKRKKRQAQNVSTDQDYPDYEEYFNFYGTDALEEDINDEKKIVYDKKDADTINDLPREIHCDLVQTFKKQCAEYNILELWKYDEAVIRNLSRQDIINDINTVKKSPVTGYDVDFLHFLGGKTYNSTGSVVGARSIIIMWYTEWDPAKLEDTAKIIGFDINLADPFTMQWEADIIKGLMSQTEMLKDEGKGFELYLNFLRR
jgi:hypothetical protein